MALGRLHPSDEYDIRIAVEEGEGGSLDGKWIAMLVDEIEHYSGENTRLTALLAERDALRARAERAEDALRWYADERNYDRSIDHVDAPGLYLADGAFWTDRGYRARAALAASEGQEVRDE